MIPSAARAAEHLLGGAAAPAVGAFRAAAFAAMLACLIVAALQVRRALAASRAGVSLPGPAFFAAANALLAAAALGAAAPFRIADSKAPPLAALAGSWGYLFFAALILFLAVALAPGPRGAAARVAGGMLAAACFPGALVLLFFTRAADPPLPVVIGTLWQTPSALYVSSGDRGRRESDTAAPVEADLVEARSALFGLSRQGLAGFRSGGRAIPWRGDGGLGSRIAARWPGALSGALFSVHRFTRTVQMRPNERIWILRGPDGIVFSTVDAAPAAPDLRRPD